MDKPTSYEDRLIIYLDILGFSNFVELTTNKKLNIPENIKKIDGYLVMLKKYFTDDPLHRSGSSTRQVTSFSDSIVISINLKEIGNMGFEISEIHSLILSSLQQGFLLRGAIVYGKLIHTNNSIFGTGLIEAYNKEKNIAKYPRVIIDDSIVSDLKELQKKNKNYIAYISIEDFILRDSDGFYYIDIFKSLRSYYDLFWQYTDVLYSISNILSEQIGNPLLKQKHVWLRDKFVNHVNENSIDLEYSFINKEITQEDLLQFKACLSKYDNKEK